jgi:hypothetical protein
MLRRWIRGSSSCIEINVRHYVVYLCGAGGFPFGLDSLSPTLLVQCGEKVGHQFLLHTLIASINLLKK